MQGGDEYAEDSSDEEVGLGPRGVGVGGLPWVGCAAPATARPEWASWPRAPLTVWKSDFGVGDT